MSARSRHFVNMGIVFLPSVCDGFCVSVFSLGQGSRRFVTNFMDNPRSCSAGVNEMRVFGNCLYSLCRPRFLVSLVHCRRIQQLCLFPFLVCTQTYLEVCIVEHIVARSVSSSEFSLLSASVCVAPFFSNPCLQGWATICSFVYMGARDSCLRA